MSAQRGPSASGFLALVAGLAVLAGIGILGYFAVGWMADGAAELEREATAYVLAILLAALLVAHGLRRSAALHAQERERAAKRAAYARFLDGWAPLVGFPEQDAELPSKLTAEKELLLVAGKGVIESYWDWRWKDERNGRAGAAEKLLAEMRKELGLADSGFKTGQLLHLLEPPQVFSVREEAGSGDGVV